MQSTQTDPFTIIMHVIQCTSSDQDFGSSLSVLKTYPDQCPIFGIFYRSLTIGKDILYNTVLSSLIEKIQRPVAHWICGRSQNTSRTSPVSATCLLSLSDHLLWPLVMDPFCFSFTRVIAVLCQLKKRVLDPCLHFESYTYKVIPHSPTL